MFERVFPNLYGWLVWGGGFRQVRYAAISAAVIASYILTFWIGTQFSG